MMKHGFMNIQECQYIRLHTPENRPLFNEDNARSSTASYARREISCITEGKELKNDERTSIKSGDGLSCLLLQNITADESGKYGVSVENRSGTDTSYTYVSVEGSPDPPNGKPCLLPHPTSNAVTIAWSSSPYDGGRKILAYMVEYSLAGSEIWSSAIDDCDSLSCVLQMGGTKGTLLRPGGRYVFRVRAINVHGVSEPSMESDVLQIRDEDEILSFEPRTVQLESGIDFKQKYELHEELGKGRYGMVHKIVEKSSGRKFAGKFVRCRTTKDKEKVRQEIEIMNQLRHPKLLQLAAAYEIPRDIVMIMEYISGGELFERIVADDFTLTEKDCMLFMRQICEGVAYMHQQHVAHLDLKPENIMCRNSRPKNSTECHSHEIKIIDFGLARRLDPENTVRVLFGTPEFIAPEIINYEPIGTESDMWSVGVICYVLLSGLSPFMGDNDAETFANITRAEYDFDDESFDAVSQSARDFIGALLLKRKEPRMSAEESLKHIWLDPSNHKDNVVICTDKLKKFIIRRKWQKTGNAIRALGRMATLSASRRNSSSSTGTGASSSKTQTARNNMQSVAENDSEFVRDRSILDEYDEKLEILTARIVRDYSKCNEFHGEDTETQEHNKLNLLYDLANNTKDISNELSDITIEDSHATDFSELRHNSDIQNISNPTNGLKCIEFTQIKNETTSSGENLTLIHNTNEEILLENKDISEDNSVQISTSASMESLGQNTLLESGNVLDPLPVVASLQEIEHGKVKDAELALMRGTYAGDIDISGSREHKGNSTSKAHSSSSLNRIRDSLTLDTIQTIRPSVASVVKIFDHLDTNNASKTVPRTKKVLLLKSKRSISRSPILSGNLKSPESQREFLIPTVTMSTNNALNNNVNVITTNSAAFQNIKKTATVLTKRQLLKPVSNLKNTIPISDKKEIITIFEHNLNTVSTSSKTSTNIIKTLNEEEIILTNKELGNYASNSNVEKTIRNLRRDSENLRRENFSKAAAFWNNLQ